MFSAIRAQKVEAIGIVPGIHVYYWGFYYQDLYSAAGFGWADTAHQESRLSPDRAFPAVGCGSGRYPTGESRDSRAAPIRTNFSPFISWTGRSRQSAAVPAGIQPAKAGTPVQHLSGLISHRSSAGPGVPGSRLRFRQVSNRRKPGLQDGISGLISHRSSGSFCMPGPT